jgi:hypothetical protein
MTLLDDISPRYMGEDRIRLTLSDPDQLLQVFRPVLITVDYSRCLPQGVVLPLEFTVTGPGNVLTERHVSKRFAPTTLVFVPKEGGSFLVRLGEMWHDLWWGKLVLEIAGDRLRGA